MIYNLFCAWLNHLSFLFKKLKINTDRFASRIRNQCLYCLNLYCLSLQCLRPTSWPFDSDYLVANELFELFAVVPTVMRIAVHLILCLVGRQYCCSVFCASVRYWLLGSSVYDTDVFIHRYPSLQSSCNTGIVTTFGSFRYFCYWYQLLTPGTPFGIYISLKFDASRCWSSHVLFHRLAFLFELIGRAGNYYL